jgi:hypothetical protein
VTFANRQLRAASPLFGKLESWTKVAHRSVGLGAKPAGRLVYLWRDDVLYLIGIIRMPLGASQCHLSAREEFSDSWRLP